VRAAYAYARTRARRSSLLRPDQLDALRAAEGHAAVISALRACGIEARDEAAAYQACLARFVADAERLAAAWPRPEVLFALAGLLEAENLKLGCRAVRAGPRAARWRSLWLPLGRVARLAPEIFHDAASLRAAIERLPQRPWGEAARKALRAHEHDPAAFEMALDAFASRRLLDAAAADRGSRRLCEAVVRLRDVEAIGRASVRSVSADDAAAFSVLLRRELPAQALRALAAGEVAEAVRSAFRVCAADLPALLSSLRARLRSECLRAFRGTPFAPETGVALLLLRLDDLHAVAAVAEAQLGGEAG